MGDGFFRKNLHPGDLRHQGEYLGNYIKSTKQVFVSQEKFCLKVNIFVIPKKLWVY